VDELKPQPSDGVIRKTRYDGFFGTFLEDLLRVYGVKHLVVTGTVANIRVLHTAGSAALRWFKVYIPLDAVSALNDFDYYTALRQASFLYKATLVKTAENVHFK
jgi:nicotinamidase-related amidase